MLGTSRDKHAPFAPTLSRKFLCACAGAARTCCRTYARVCASVCAARVVCWGCDPPSGPSLPDPSITVRCFLRPAPSRHRRGLLPCLCLCLCPCRHPIAVHDRPCLCWYIARHYVYHLQFTCPIGLHSRTLFCGRHAVTNPMIGSRVALPDVMWMATSIALMQKWCPVP